MADAGVDPNNPDRKRFVLCFDGTGNKFEGKDTDSNILKIYRLLDRTQPNQYSWYNPGIGTYVQSTSLEHTSAGARLKSWYTKMKDEAVGSSVGDHVMAGYRFLMRYYTTDDDIYVFGFSRGAYTARFLAEMLDHIGLLSAGNEELQRFAWKTFSKWQARAAAKTDQEKAKNLELYNFMKNFRETFSRPVRRIRFLGLFDTVNSVPRFENAWMQRTKYPYTAKSSAKVIRHAVSINERRAKFRVDLISGKGPEDNQNDKDKPNPFHRYQSDLPAKMDMENVNGEPKKKRHSSPFRDRSKSPSQSGPGPFVFTSPPRDGNQSKESAQQTKQQPALVQPSNLLKPARPEARRVSSYTEPYITHSTEDLQASTFKPHERKKLRRRFSDLRRSQDILEVWFSGNHGDIGGGWPRHNSETWPLSHAPLVWMVDQAQQAGLKFDPEKLVALNCCPDKIDDYGNRDEAHEKQFHEALHQSSVSGFIHDCLEFGGGLNGGSVLSWKLMEYLPFRRMDLLPQGGWKPIRWPLPKGEVRDVPADAKVHVSAIRRMEEDKKYRPGNLICLGEGGRGKRTAPKDKGMGEWVVWDKKGDRIGEIWVGGNWTEGQGVRGQVKKVGVEEDHGKKAGEEQQEE